MELTLFFMRAFCILLLLFGVFLTVRAVWSFFYNLWFENKQRRIEEIKKYVFFYNPEEEHRNIHKERL